MATGSVGTIRLSGVTSARRFLCRTARQARWTLLVLTTLCLIVGEGIVGEGRLARADEPMPPPFELSWGMTARAFADQLRAKGGDKAVEAFGFLDQPGVKMSATYDAGEGKPLPAWPALPASTGEASFTFDDVHGLVNVDWRGAPFKPDGSAATYDQALQRFATVRDALIEKYGAPSRTGSWNDGKTPQEKFGCLAYPVCGQEYAEWRKGGILLRLEIVSAHLLRNDELAVRARWFHSAYEETYLKEFRRDKSPPPAKAVPPPSPPEPKPRF
jgi:hypothetical protein